MYNGRLKLFVPSMKQCEVRQCLPKSDAIPRNTPCTTAFISFYELYTTAIITNRSSTWPSTIQDDAIFPDMRYGRNLLFIRKEVVQGYEYIKMDISAWKSVRRSSEQLNCRSSSLSLKLYLDYRPLADSEIKFYLLRPRWQFPRVAWMPELEV